MGFWNARLSALVARKEREAQGARLEPFETEFERDGSGLIRVGNAWSEGLFGGPFCMSPVPSDVPGANLVFVQSRDGNTGAADPSSLGGGETDKHLIYEGLSRVAADAVLGGAETIRGGDVLLSVWREELVQLRLSLGKRRHPTQVVATLRGLAFDETLLYNVPDVPVVVITVATCAEAIATGLAERPWITAIVMEDKNDLRSAFVQLRRMGIDRVSVIGGRTVATALIDAGLIQDIYLTTSPRPGGTPNTPMYSKPLDADPVVRKRGTGTDAGVVFEHLVRRSSASARS